MTEVLPLQGIKPCLDREKYYYQTPNTYVSPSPPPPQQMYIAQVLQDPNSEEAGSGSGEDDGQGSSQDEDIINVENSLNEDFQSGEDSLLDNEVRH